MRIALLTSGRFTIVDLARELSALGHEVRVYSLLPAWRTKRFGLPSECNRWLGAYVAPFYAADRLASNTRLHSYASRGLVTALDSVAALKIEPCDVLVAMSSIGLRSLHAVRRRYGAKVFLERSSRHVLSQRAILRLLPGANVPVSDWAVDRELAGYELADVVSVPARHVERSFLEQGFSQQKLFRNPFGTSLDDFRPTPPPDGPKTIVMTGAWSLRKGCDVLVDAWRRLPGTRLVHVGPVGDAPLPSDPLFQHFDTVPQRELLRFYANAHVFALASREEGLAVVQVQALACGLRLVCTTRTGGEDLGEWTTAKNAVFVVPPDDPKSFSNALAAALAQESPAGAPRDLLGTNRENASWRAYARRYAARMQEALDG